MNKCITLSVNVPDGYEPTGEFRKPIIEEPFLDVSGMLCAGKAFGLHAVLGPRIILRRIEPFAVRPMSRNEVLVILTRQHTVVSVMPDSPDMWDHSSAWSPTAVFDNFDRIRYAFITEGGVIGQPQKFEKRV
jgi:hypothetical protein